MPHFKPAMWRLLAAGLAAGTLLLCLAAMASADRGGDTPVTAVPAEGSTGRLRLRSQTVDISISSDDQGVWADTQVWLQISNPFTRVVSMTLALPGPRLAPGNMPGNVELRIADTPLATQPAPGPAGGLLAELSVLPGGEAAVQLTYRQALSETQGLTLLGYPLAASGQWGRAPESLRVTVKFADAVAAEQILALAPEPQVIHGQTLQWSWDGKNAPDVWLAFFAPRWWSQFAAARTAAAAPDVQPAQHLALSRLYQQMAALPQLPFAPDLDLYGRYYPAAVAELQAAAAAGDGSGPPASEAVTAHAQLSNLYRAQADRLGRGAGDTYLELAATEAQAALALGADDAGLRSFATETYMKLAAAARADGDVARADGYLSKVGQLQPRASTAGEEQKAARLALAEEQLGRGEPEAARQILLQTYGAEAIDIPALRAPAAGQILVAVETEIDGPAGEPGQPASRLLTGRRRVNATLTGARNPEALHSLIEQAAQSWRSVPGLNVKTGPDSLAIEFAFGDEQALGEMESRLVRLMPNVPELTLMGAAMSPESLALRVDEPRLRRVWRYGEGANLAEAAFAWGQRADEVRAASLRLAPPAAAISPTAAVTATGAAPAAHLDLGQVQRALWGANALAWDELAAHSYVQYSVQMGAGGVERQWQVPAGSQRSLTAERVTWVPEQLLLAAAGAGLLVLLLSILLWRLL